MKNSKFKGKLFSQEVKNLKVHTYVSPEETFMVTSHVIETEQSLVIIDAQFMLEYAIELKEFIESLSKPVEMLVVSHSHPDHFLGLEVFQEYPIASSREIIDEISISADDLIVACQKFHGNRITSKKVIPSVSLMPGKHEIAGVSFDIELIDGAEAGKQLLFKLPVDGIIIAQDIVYNNVHAFFAQQEIENWIAKLTDLIADGIYSIVLPGHGEPCNLEKCHELIRYLRFVEKVLAVSQNKDELKSQLMEEFPEYRAAHLIDIASDYVFHGEHLVN